MKYDCVHTLIYFCCPADSLVEENKNKNHFETKIWLSFVIYATEIAYW